MGIIICFIAFGKSFGSRTYGVLGYPNSVMGSITTFNPVVGIGIPILIIGSLLIYTLRTRRK